MPFPTTVLVRRHRPPKVGKGHNAYAKYRHCLRADFDHACCYCGFYEAQVGLERWGGFEIEHFRPQGRAEFRKLGNKYTNLLWSCAHCNGAKGQTWPTPDEATLGCRFVDPTVERLADFLQEVGDQVESLHADDPVAAFLIEEIELNSAVLKARRNKRRSIEQRLETMRATVEAVQNEIDGANLALVALLDQHQKEIAELKKSLMMKADTAVEVCACK